MIGVRARGMVAMLAACSLANAACDLAVSLSGLTGGRVEPIDASPPLDASTLLDAMGPSGVPDASSTPDDALFCDTLSPAPTFCEDFDHGPFGPDWDSVTDAGGSLTLTSTEVVSKPYAAEYSIAAVGPTAPVNVELRKAFPALAGLPMTATLSFDIRFDDVDEQSSAAQSVMCAIDLVDDATSTIYEVEIAVAYGGPSGLLPTLAEMTILQDGGTPDYNEVDLNNTPLPLQTWTNIQLVYRLPSPDAGANNSLEFYIGPAHASTISSVPVTVVNGIPRIIVGTGYVTAGSNPWKFVIDNVTFSAVPL